MDAPLLPPPNPNLPEARPHIFFVVIVVFLFTLVAVTDLSLLPIFTISTVAAAASMLIHGFHVFFPQQINHHRVIQKVSQVAVIVGILWGYHSFDLSRYSTLIVLFNSTLLGAYYGVFISPNYFNFCVSFAVIVTFCFIIPSLLPDEFERKFLLYAVFAAFAGFNLLRCFWEENIRRFYYGGLRRPNAAANAVDAAA